MRRSTTRGRDALAAVGLAAALITAGCTATSGPSAPSGTVVTSSGGPPAIARPLDATLVAESPCSRLLTEEELQMFGISTAGRTRVYLGVRECSWTSAADDRLRIGVVTSRDLLADTYRSAHSPIFEPTAVAGYPSVRQQTSRNYNTCDVTTGLGGTQALETDWTGSAPASPAVDPCERAEEAIALVIGKLPPHK